MAFRAWVRWPVFWSPTMIRSRLFCLPCGLFLAALLFALPSHAATNCSATMTPINFGTVNPTGSTDVSATVTVTCDSLGLGALGTVYVRMCLYLGTGSAGTAITPRTMQNGFGDALQYDVYSGPGFVGIWGDTLATRIPLDLSYAVILLAGNGSISHTVNARIPFQVGLAAGNHQSNFSGIHTELRYRYDEPVLFLGSTWPASCETGGSGGATGLRLPFTASANVLNHCTVGTTTDLDFGAIPGLIRSDHDQTSTISLNCTRRTAWNVALSNGQNAVDSTRRMRLGSTGNYVDYELYRNAGRTLRWGQTVGGDTETGTGEGTAQSLTVHGRVAAPQNVPAGNYRDTVIVTLTY